MEIVRNGIGSICSFPIENPCLSQKTSYPAATSSLMKPTRPSSYRSSVLIIGRGIFQRDKPTYSAMLMGVNTTLEDLRQELGTWKGIDIAKKSNPVFGHGNSHSSIVFVGEAPGKNEDEQGIPFVGQSGKLLNELLASINLERSDVYITNIVKFRPPNNRDPTKAEKEACFRFLEAELAIIQPKVIVPLGRHALAQFLPKKTISEAHGKAYTLEDGRTVFPLYHPAAALYNPNLRATLFSDFLALKTLLSE